MKRDQETSGRPDIRTNGTEPAGRPRRKAALLVAVAFPLAAAACDLGTTVSQEVHGDVPDPIHPRDAEFHPDLGVDIDAMEEIEDGLYYLDEEEGEGDELGQGKIGVFEYWGYLPNGHLFDSSDFHAQPLQYNVDQDRMIEGFQLGVDRMLEGTTRLLVIPAHLGYGIHPPQGIPPNSILVFRLELVEVR